MEFPHDTVGFALALYGSPRVNALSETLKGRSIRACACLTGCRGRTSEACKNPVVRPQH